VASGIFWLDSSVRMVRCMEALVEGRRQRSPSAIRDVILLLRLHFSPFMRIFFTSSRREKEKYARYKPEPTPYFKKALVVRSGQFSSVGTTQNCH
jgi:hypothetical protein